MGECRSQVAVGYDAPLGSPHIPRAVSAPANAPAGPGARATSVERVVTFLSDGIKL